MTINIGLRRQNFQLEYYKNGTAPSSIYTAPADMSMEQVSKFRKWLSGVFSGNSAERRVGLVLPPGMNVVDTKGEILKDEYDDWLARIVCYAFSVSPSALVKAVNRATAETAQEQALDEGLEPLKDWVRNIMKRCFIRMGRPEAQFVFKLEEEIDPLKQAQIYQLYILSGVLTPNEVRKKIGYNTDIELPPEPPEPPTPNPTEPTPVEKLGKKGRRRRIVTQQLNRNRPEILAWDTKYSANIARIFAKSRKKIVGKVIRAYKELEKSADSQALAKADKSKKVTSGISPDDLEDLEKYLEKSGVEVFKLGDTAASEQIGFTVSVKQQNERAVAWAKDHAAEQITKISDSTRDAIRATVSKALEEGWSPDQLAETLENDWAFSPERADTIARTETAMADAAGNMAAYKASGMVQGVEWLIADGECCEDCQANADAGVIALGDSFPSGDTEPPAHPNCRCDVSPVLVEEDEVE